MTEVKRILLGVILGGVITYFFIDNSSSKIETSIKTKECSKVKEQIVYKDMLMDKTQIKEERNDKETKKVKERQKTPDELYEEQHKEEYGKDNEESNEVINSDEDVVSLEQKEAEEGKIASLNITIDRNIIPIELEEAEKDKSLKLSKEELEEDVPYLIPMTEDVTEGKEVIPDELRDIEEYGDNSDTSDESDIPL